MSRWKLASFDLDGTLSRGISTGQHLAKKIGHSDHMAELERDYEKGKITNFDVATADASYYKGLTYNDIEDLLEDLPVLADISETIKYLAKQGVPSVLCTIAWSDVARAISNRFGFVDWSGPILEVDSAHKFTGKVSKHFEAEDKVRFIKGICGKSGFSISEVFHVGDSRSDIELFREVGFSLALNASEQAKQVATFSLDTESLLDIVSVIPKVKE